MPGQNYYPDADNYPAPSFPQPVPAPDIDPDAGILIPVEYSAAWVEVVMGALEQLLLPGTWQGNHDEKILALNRAENLRYLLQERAPVPAPYWTTPETADDREPSATQQWYGELVPEFALLDEPEGLTFLENVGIWGITAFIVYSGQIGAAIAFKTFADRFVLAWKKSGVGGAIRVFIDGVDQGLLDTYDPDGGILEQIFHALEPVEEHEIIQVLESKPEGAPDHPTSADDAAMQTIRKRLTEAEVDVVTNIRQNPGSGQLEMERGGAWENVPTAENVRRDGTVTMTDALSVLSTAGIVARFNRNATGGAIFNVGGATGNPDELAVRMAITASLLQTGALWRARVMLNVRGSGGGTAEILRGDYIANGVPLLGVLGAAGSQRVTITGARDRSPATQALLQALQAFGYIVNSTTLGSVPGTRYNPDCDCVEVTVDGGDTWVEDETADPRHSEAFRLPALTGEDARCRAAEGMALLVRSLVDARLNDAGYIELAGLILGIVGFIPGFNVLYALVLALASFAVSIAVGILEAAFTEEVYDQIRCIFYCAIGEDGQMSAAQFADAYANLIELEPVARTWVQHVMTTFGEVGMSDAGVALAAAADCDECACICEDYSDPMTTEIGAQTQIADWNVSDISQFPTIPGDQGVYVSSGGATGGGYLQSTLTPAGTEKAAVALIDLGRQCTVNEAYFQRYQSGSALGESFIGFYSADHTRVGFQGGYGLLPTGWQGVVYGGAPVANVRYIMMWTWAGTGVTSGIDDLFVGVT